MVGGAPPPIERTLGSLAGTPHLASGRGARRQCCYAGFATAGKPPHLCVFHAGGAAGVPSSVFEVFCSESPLYSFVVSVLAA